MVLECVLLWLLLILIEMIVIPEYIKHLVIINEGRLQWKCQNRVVIRKDRKKINEKPPPVSTNATDEDKYPIRDRDDHTSSVPEINEGTAVKIKRSYLEIGSDSVDDDEVVQDELFNNGDYTHHPCEETQLHIPSEVSGRRERKCRSKDRHSSKTGERDESSTSFASCKSSPVNSVETSSLTNDAVHGRTRTEPNPNDCLSRFTEGACIKRPVTTERPLTCRQLPFGNKTYVEHSNGGFDEREMPGVDGRSPGKDVPLSENRVLATNCDIPDRNGNPAWLSFNDTKWNDLSNDSFIEEDAMLTDEVPDLINSGCQTGKANAQIDHTNNECHLRNSLKLTHQSHSGTDVTVSVFTHSDNKVSLQCGDNNSLDIDEGFGSMSQSCVDGAEVNSSFGIEMNNDLSKSTELKNTDLHNYSIPSCGGLHNHSIPSCGGLHNHSIPSYGGLHNHSIPSYGGLHNHSIPSYGGIHNTYPSSNARLHGVNLPSTITHQDQLLLCNTELQQPGNNDSTPGRYDGQHFSNLSSDRRIPEFSHLSGTGLLQDSSLPISEELYNELDDSSLDIDGLHDLTPSDNGRLHDPTPLDNGRLHDPTPSDNGCLHDLTPSDHGRLHDPTPSSKGRLHDPTPSDNGRLHEHTPPDNGRLHDPTPSSNDRLHDLTPSDNGRLHDPTPSDIGRLHDLTPSDNGRLHDPTPSDNGCLHDPTPSDNGRLHDPTPSSNGCLHDLTPSDNGCLHDPTPSDNGRLHDPTPSDNGRLHDPTASDNSRLHDPTPSDNGRLHNPTPSDNGRLHNPTPSDNVRLHDPTQSDNGRLHDPTPSDNVRLHEHTPPDNVRLHDHTPSDNIRLHEHTPPDNVRLHDPTPSDNVRLYEHTPSRNGRLHDHTPSDNSRLHYPTPSDNGRLHDPTPSDNGRLRDLTPSDNGRLHDLTPSDNGRLHDPNPSDNGRLHDHTPSDTGRIHDPTPSDGKYGLHDPTQTANSCIHDPTPSDNIHLHATTKPSNGGLHDPTTSSKSNLYATTQPSKDGLHDPTTCSKSDIYATPQPSKGGLHDPTTSSKSNLHATIQPSNDGLHDPNTSIKSDLHATTQPSNGALHDPTPSSKNDLHATLQQSNGGLHNPNTSSNSDLFATPQPSNGDRYASTQPNNHGLHDPIPASNAEFQDPTLHDLIPIIHTDQQTPTLSTRNGLTDSHMFHDVTLLDPSHTPNNGGQLDHSMSSNNIPLDQRLIKPKRSSYLSEGTELRVQINEDRNIVGTHGPNDPNPPFSDRLYPPSLEINVLPDPNIPELYTDANSLNTDETILGVCSFIEVHNRDRIVNSGTQEKDFPKHHSNIQSDGSFPNIPEQPTAFYNETAINNTKDDPGMFTDEYPNLHTSDQTEPKQVDKYKEERGPFKIGILPKERRCKDVPFSDYNLTLRVDDGQIIVVQISEHINIKCTRRQDLKPTGTNTDLTCGFLTHDVNLCFPMVDVHVHGQHRVHLQMGPRNHLQVGQSKTVSTTK